jgi:hypothetical protein
MEIIYRQHAIKRMHEREISAEDIEAAIECGEIIECYPNDTPYPSVLVLGEANSKNIHIVYADSDEDNLRIIITAYVPNPEIWLEDMKTRRTK